MPPQQEAGGHLLPLSQGQETPADILPGKTNLQKRGKVETSSEGGKKKKKARSVCHQQSQTKGNPKES